MPDMLDEARDLVAADDRKDFDFAERGFIATLKDQYHVTSIVVSHDRDLALNIADRVGILMGGELLFLGTPAELRKPQNPRVADFLNPKIDLQNPRFKRLET